MRQSWIWTLLLATPLSIGIAGCSAKTEKSDEGNGKGGKVKLALPTAEKPIDQSYITDDFVGAVVAHPARVLNSKLTKDVIAAADKFAPGKFEKGLREINDDFGVDVTTVEQVVVLFDDKVAAGLQGAGPKETPGFIVRSSGSLDEVKVLDAFTKAAAKESGEKSAAPEKKSADPPEKSATPPKKSAASAKPEKKTHEGKTYYSANGGKMAFSIVEGKTLIGASEETLKKMLSAGKPTSALAKRLATIGAEHDLIVVAAGGAFEKQIQQSVDGFAFFVPDSAKEYLPHAKKMKSIALTVSVTSNPMISVVVGMPDESAATEFANLVETKALKLGKEQYEQYKKKAPPEAGEAVAVADELVDSIRAGAKGTDVIISVGRPSQLDDLPRLIQEAMMKKQ